MNFEKFDPKTLAENPVKLIGDDWMLITAGNRDSFNTMTASWGAFGCMWNKPALTVFVRPTRFTFGFIEKCSDFTVSFLPQSHKDALRICGSKSGRDCDKVALANLTPLFTESGNVYFAEARLVFECRKIYSQMMDEKSFIDKAPVERWYSDSNFHKMYIGTVETALRSNA